jgi:hypothetical protein
MTDQLHAIASRHGDIEEYDVRSDLGQSFFELVGIVDGKNFEP